jgi:lipopolysaccharide export LptBFGC system permease protein LptF
VDRQRRHRTYFALMGTCVLLILLAWNVVRLWSTTAAVVMSVVAALLPPVAAFVGNQGALDGSAPPAVDEDRG